MGLDTFVNNEACTRFRAVYDRVQKLISEYTSNDILQQEFSLSWLKSMRRQLDSIINLHKLKTDEYGHGYIRLYHSPELKEYLSGFNASKSIKKISPMPQIDQDFIHVEVLKRLQSEDCCNANNPVIINNEWLDELMTNMQHKYSKQFLLDFIEELYVVQYEKYINIYILLY